MQHPEQKPIDETSRPSADEADSTTTAERGQNSHARVGGGALAGGFLLVLLVLYRDPGRGFDVAAGDGQALLFFAVLPVVGILAGLYSYRGRPYSGVPLFLLGSYLGLFGLALALGSVLAQHPPLLPLAAGLLMLALSVVALAASVLQVIPFIEPNAGGQSPEEAISATDAEDS